MKNRYTKIKFQFVNFLLLVGCLISLILYAQLNPKETVLKFLLQEEIQTYKKKISLPIALQNDSTVVIKKVSRGITGTKLLVPINDPYNNGSERDVKINYSNLSIKRKDSIPTLFLWVNIERRTSWDGTSKTMIINQVVDKRHTIVIPENSIIF